MSDSGARSHPDDFQAILDTIPDTVARYDRSLTRLYANKAAERFDVEAYADTEGMTAEDLVQTAHDAGLTLDPAVGAAWVATLQQVFDTGEAATFEGQFITKDGVPSYYHSAVVPEFGPDGQVVTVLEVSRDISDKVRADDEAKLLATLAKRNEELEQVIYAISHDLQEPLRTISSYLEIFRTDFGGKLGPEADEYIEFVSQASARLRTQVRGLLEFSRVESTGRPPETLNLADLVKEVALDLNMARSVQIEPLPFVWADPAQLRRVIQNILSNSKKYRRHEVPLEVRVFQVGHTNGHTTIGIADNGMGIETEYLERIFRIFYRLHAHHMIPGTGLGLALVQKIISRHHGRVWVESVPGQGSTFFFTLPREPEARTDSLRPGRPQ